MIFSPWQAIHHMLTLTAKTNSHAFATACQHLAGSHQQACDLEHSNYLEKIYIEGEDTPSTVRLTWTWMSQSTRTARVVSVKCLGRSALGKEFCIWVLCRVKPENRDTVWTSVCANPRHCPPCMQLVLMSAIAKKPFCWYHWAKAGIVHLGDLHETGHIVTFKTILESGKCGSMEISPTQAPSPLGPEI